MYKFLSLLKENTDKDYAITQHGLKNLLGEEKARDILGDKGTCTRRLKELALNNTYRLILTDEWRIYTSLLKKCVL